MQACVIHKAAGSYTLLGRHRTKKAFPVYNFCMCVCSLIDADTIVNCKCEQMQTNAPDEPV
jgi:hypothetical protein